MKWTSALSSALVFLAPIGTHVQAKDAERVTNDWIENAKGQILEYTSNANPYMPEVPVRVFPPELHQQGHSRIIHLDLSEELDLNYTATAPNLLASFVRVLEGEAVHTSVDFAATSQAFYVIRGSGSSTTRAGDIEWSAGDLFVLPYLGDQLPSVCGAVGAAGAEGAPVPEEQCVRHVCSAEPSTGGCAIYWVHDEPLLKYLGVRPAGGADRRRFEPTLFSDSSLRDEVAKIAMTDPVTGEPRNRRGVLLSNKDTNSGEDRGTKTLTPTLWSLLNVLAAGSDQEPHRHNSVALDLAVDDGAAGGEDEEVYTLMGPTLDASGTIVDPLKLVWKSGGVFVTPPGWWHSHHSRAGQDAWVLPIQDAGVYTHQRTLDIRFAGEEAARISGGVSRGATIDHGAYSERSGMIAGSLSLGLESGALASASVNV